MPLRALITVMDETLCDIILIRDASLGGDGGEKWISKATPNVPEMPSKEKDQTTARRVFAFRIAAFLGFT